MVRNSIPQLLLMFNLTCILAHGQIPTLDLGPDTSYCSNSSITIISNLIDTSYSYLWNTGDTIDFIEVGTTGVYWLHITYDTIIEIETDTGIVLLDSIIELVDTVMITINNNPILGFSTIDNCYTTPSLIINNSTFDTGSTITYIIGLDTLISNADTISYPELLNGQSVMVYSTIDQLNGCSEHDTFELKSLLKPTILLTVDSTCENVTPFIVNSSTSTSPSYGVSIFEIETWVFPGMDSFQIPLQSSGLHSYTCILTNSNGCSDSMHLPLYIHDIQPREIIGLDISYCAGDPEVIIQGNFPGGYFTGPYIQNTLPGQAIFNPSEVDSLLEVVYFYTDSNGCIDSTTFIVESIFALPSLTLFGLDTAYCQYDDNSLITSSPAGGFFSGQGLSNITSSSATFSPTLIGSSFISYEFTDLNNGCYNIIHVPVTVFPLPSVDLGPVDPLLISSGMSIVIGPNPIDTTIMYTWSTGETMPNIEVSNPGYYILQGMNPETGCKALDTIRIELINSTNLRLSKEEFTVFPNPFNETIQIHSDSRLSNIELYNALGQKIKIRLDQNGKLTSIIILGECTQINYLRLNSFNIIPVICLE